MSQELANALAITHAIVCIITIFYFNFSLIVRLASKLICCAKCPKCEHRHHFIDSCNAQVMNNYNCTSCDHIHCNKECSEKYSTREQPMFLGGIYYKTTTYAENTIFCCKCQDCKCYRCEKDFTRECLCSNCQCKLCTFQCKVAKFYNEKMCVFNTIVTVMLGVVQTIEFIVFLCKLPQSVALDIVMPISITLCFINILFQRLESVLYYSTQTPNINYGCCDCIDKSKYTSI